MSINLDGFEIIKPISRQSSFQYVCISNKGDVQINSSLLKTVNLSGIEILMPKDGKRMAIRNGGKNPITIPKSGRFKNYDILSRLISNKVKFPIYYVGEWSDNIWMGVATHINPKNRQEFQSKL